MSEKLSKNTGKAGKTRKKFIKAADIFRAALFFALIIFGAVYYYTHPEAAIPKPGVGAVNRVGRDSLVISFIDVGQGDSTLIIAPGDEAMLIDTGMRDKFSNVENELKKNGVTALKYLVLTHPHDDHIGGASEILERFEVSEVIMLKTAVDSPAYSNLIRAMSESNTAAVYPSPGDKFSLGEAEFTILTSASAVYEDMNDASMMLRLVCKDTSAVFTGDAGEIPEGEIIDAFGASSLKSDVLKVGHHGSSSSTSARFLQAVQPDFAVISCEKNNDYGHPHGITLRKLTDIGAQIYRTDISGTVTLISDGKEFTYYEAAED
ncbi:MAG TPA: MBL fold metallo-hydrolase [Clostridiales bacterium]|jgi:competence protein ComEC|nr:MBL fold metallo-hydrolase [Clostridiales bacterium]